jgi:hypothetical protein
MDVYLHNTLASAVRVSKMVSAKAVSFPHLIHPWPVRYGTVGTSETVWVSNSIEQSS